MVTKVRIGLVNAFGAWEVNCQVPKRHRDGWKQVKANLEEKKGTG